METGSVCKQRDVAAGSVLTPCHEPFLVPKPSTAGENHAWAAFCPSSFPVFHSALHRHIQK